MPEEYRPNADDDRKPEEDRYDLPADDQVDSGEVLFESEEEPVGEKRHISPGRPLKRDDFIAKKPEPEEAPAPAYEPEPVREPVGEPVFESEPVQEFVYEEPISGPTPYEYGSEPVGEPVSEPIQEPSPAYEPIREPEPRPAVVGSPRHPVQDPDQPESAVAPAPESPKKQKSSSGSPVSALKGMLSFFTIFKIGADDKEIEAADKSMYMAPAVGFIIGLAAALVATVLYLLIGLSNEVLAISVIATVCILTKFLHFDGLADFGDGMVVSGNQDDHIRALKDSRIGAGGVGLALIVTLMSVLCLSEFSDVVKVEEWDIEIITIFLAAVIPMEVLAKNTMVCAAAFGKPGNGMASEQVGNTNQTSMLISVVLSFILAFVGFALMAAVTLAIDDTSLFYGDALITAVAAIAVALLASVGVGWLMAHLANKNFGYVNGDVLGASNEIGRAAVLLVALIVCSLMI